MRLRFAICLLILLPNLAGAEHACEDGYPMGTPIKSVQPLPRDWFLVGSQDVRSDKTHSNLKESFGKKYISGFEEGGDTGSLCLKLSTGYVNVTTNGFGSGVRYMMSLPKCAKCEPINVPEKDFETGTGLRLGLTKTEASKILKSKIIANLTDITFDEVETISGKKAYRTEMLSMEFINDRLVRFGVFQYEEGEP
jgi:hypothetical protein